MARIDSAHVRHFPAGSYGGEHRRVDVVSVNTPRFVYDEIECEDGTAYLALDGDVGNFLFDNGSGTGFGGSTYQLRMRDGSLREVKGPWSSSCSSMNRIFALDDPLVECVDQNSCLVYVKRSVLERFGIELKYRAFNAHEGYYHA